MRLLLILLAFISFGTAPVASDIPWNENRKLKWSDFQERNQSSHGHFAYTFARIDYKYDWKKSGRTYLLDPSVNATFIHSSSWTIPSKQTDYLLAHEQLHFDITELHARYLREKLSTYTYKDGYQSDIKRIVDKVFADHEAMQRKYDAETNHSLVKDAQVKWDKFIADELMRMKEFKK